MELKEQLDALNADLKAYFAKAAEEQKNQGTVTEELKSKIDAMQKQADALDVKLAERHAAGAPDETLQEILEKNDDLRRFMKARTGTVGIELDAKTAARMFERKTTIDSAAVGYASSGILQIDRSAGIVGEARRVHRVRDQLTARATTLAVIDFVKVNNSSGLVASPQIETHTKKEAGVTFTVVSERVRTIATWIPASKQIMDDFTELSGFIQTALPYYVDREEERQLLNGSGSGEDLHGLVTQATAFNTALLSAAAGWNKIDYLGRAIEQVEIADEMAPTFVALNPRDWWDMRLAKDGNARYILGDPMGPLNHDNLFGLVPVVTNAMTSGSFLVGSGSPVAAEIRDRQGMSVEISTQHEDYFVRNMIALRCEKRLALLVYRPGSYVTGTFTTSP